MNLGLNVVLYLGLWLLAFLLILKVDGGGQFILQLELEADLVETWLQETSRDWEDRLFIRCKLVGIFNSLMFLLRMIWVAVVIPEASKGHLFLSFHFELHKSCCNGHIDL